MDHTRQAIDKNARSCEKIKNARKGWDVAHVVEYLPNKLES
jgi:hypothetical protein